MSLRFANLQQAKKALGNKVTINYETSKDKKKSGVLGQHCARRSSKKESKMPQERLFDALLANFPQHKIVGELNPGIENRKFRIDAAFPDLKIACECDGWKYHGAHLSGFARNLQRQNLLALEGWLILRFSAGEIYKDIEACMAMVQAAVTKRCIETKGNTY